MAEESISIGEVAGIVESKSTFTVDEAEYIVNNIEGIINRAAAYTRGMLERTSHQGARNYDQQLGYTLDVDDREILTRYRRSPELRRAIGIIPNYAWRRTPKVWDDGRENTRFVKKFNELFDKFGLWQIMVRLDKLSRTFRYACLVIGYNDSPQDDPLAASDLRSPVGSLSGEEKILYFQPYGADSIDIVEWDKDTQSKRYRQPLIYRLNRENKDFSTNDVKLDDPPVEIHHSRIVHVVFDPFQSDIYGEPISLAVWDVLDDILKGVSGPIEGTWRIAVAQKLLLKLKDGVEWAQDPTSAAAEQRAADLALKLDRMIHNLTSAMVGADIDSIQQIQGVPVDPRPAAEVSWHRIAMAAEVPYRIYVGSEEGEMASTQDQDALAAKIRYDQKNHCEPQILRKFVNAMVEQGVLPSPQGRITFGDLNPETGEYEWPQPVELTGLQEAQTLSARASAAMKLQQARNEGMHVSQNEIREAAKFGPIPGGDDTDPPPPPEPKNPLGGPMKQLPDGTGEPDDVEEETGVEDKQDNE